MKLPKPPPCPVCSAPGIFVGKPDKTGQIEWKCNGDACGLHCMYNLTSVSP